MPKKDKFDIAIPDPELRSRLRRREKVDKFHAERAGSSGSSKKSSPSPVTNRKQYIDSKVKEFAGES